jgi:hypothetical protein
LAYISQALHSSTGGLFPLVTLSMTNFIIVLSSKRLWTCPWKVSYLLTYMSIRLNQ